jgi:predicted O-methyltransferase YrrM
MMFKKAIRRAINAVGYDVCRLSQVVKPPFVKPEEMATPLSQKHVDGAILYADRRQALDALPRGGVVAEIGVAAGDFSAAMLARLAPRRFDAFDLFTVHESERYMGWSPKERFDGGTQRAHYEHRFAKEIAAGVVHVHEGDSSREMERQPDSTYDVIYVDGDHSLDGVTRDAYVSARKLKSDGVLVFNDYIVFDYVFGEPYGVVQVVNDFCVNRGWQVLYFALQNALYCDIALCRRKCSTGVTEPRASSVKKSP